MHPEASKTALLVEPRNAAQMLAVSPRKLWAMTFEETPGLPYIRCGRLVRYAVDDLRHWIAERREGGCHEAP
jgi:hypothetical protein